MPIYYFLFCKIREKSFQYSKVLSLLNNISMYLKSMIHPNLKIQKRVTNKSLEFYIEKVKDGISQKEISPLGGDSSQWSINTS